MYWKAFSHTGRLKTIPKAMNECIELNSIDQSIFPSIIVPFGVFQDLKLTKYGPKLPEIRPKSPGHKWVYVRVYVIRK